MASRFLSQAIRLATRKPPSSVIRHSALPSHTRGSLTAFSPIFNRTFSSDADPLERITFDKELSAKYGWNEELANEHWISGKRLENTSPDVHAHAVYDSHRRRRDHADRHKTPPIFKSRYPDIQIPKDEHLGRFILYNLARQPKDAIAAVNAWTGETATFHDIHNRIIKAANSLVTRHGLSAGDKFAILLPNDIEYLVAFNAVVVANGVVTTINPTYLPKEVGHQLADVGAEFILTHSALLDNVTSTQEGQALKRIFVIGDVAEGTYNEQIRPWSELQSIGWRECTHTSFDKNTRDTPERDMTNFDGDAPVVVPYSSGTTGLPKGVVLSHNNLIANLLQTAAAEWNLVDGDETLQAVLPFFHIYGMIVILLSSLMRGHKVVIHPKFDLEKFLSGIQDHKGTQCHIAPPIAVALAKHPLVDNYDLSSLKTVFSGAAPLSPEIEQEVFERIGVRVKQGYGMTELSPVSHINPSFQTKPGSIGVLVPNTECKVIDIESGVPLGPGQEGEILIRGPQVMMGYLNNDEATMQTIDGDGFLHTGDIGMIDEDGFYTVVDRLKELIKYKGYQVAPAELEGILLTNPAVQDAAVIPIADETAGELPRAYIVLKADQSLTEDDVQAFMNERVAHYKQLRGGVRFTDEIPKSASGKILRRVLRSQAAEEDSAKNATAAATEAAPEASAPATDVTASDSEEGTYGYSDEYTEGEESESEERA